MDNVVLGNLCQDPMLWTTTKSGRAVARFTVAVNRRRRVGEEVVERPAVFHRVVCFGALAEHVAGSLRRGMEVLAAGEWVDDSYSDENGRRRAQVTLAARTVGPSLRWATAVVTKVNRDADAAMRPAAVSVAVVPETRHTVDVEAGLDDTVGALNQADDSQVARAG